MSLGFTKSKVDPNLCDKIDDDDDDDPIHRVLMDTRGSSPMSRKFVMWSDV